MGLRKNRKILLSFIVGVVLLPFIMFLLVVVLPILRNSLDGSEVSSFAYAIKKSRDPVSPELAKATRELFERKNAFEIEQAFLQARLKLAQTDSIFLVVDLVDSIASLEIKGVELRRCKVIRSNLNVEGEYMRKIGILSDWLSAPFVLQQEHATIPKEPIRVKEAPKNADEANLMPPEEVPVEDDVVNFWLYFNRNLSLSVKEVQPPSFSDRFRKIKERFQFELDDLGFSLRLKKPQSQVRISLELSREDAKAVYRALPDQAGLALRI
jgi:hypothetical protein